MSKDLTDVDAFTSPIHVPENADSRNDAAGDVELVAQRLANRTRNLKNRADAVDSTAAFKGVANTFTQPQTIPNLAGSVAIAADLTVGDDLIVSDQLSVIGVASIPSLSGSSTISGNLNAGNNVNAVAGVNAATVFASGHIDNAGTYRYLPTIDFHKFLALFDCFGEAELNSGGGNTNVMFPSGGDVQVWPIDLPHGATLLEVEAIVAKAGSGTMSLAVLRKSGHSWVAAPGALPTDSQIGLATTGATGFRTLSVTGLSQAIDNNANQCVAHITSGDANDSVYGLRVLYTDPGPRNH